MAKVSPLFFGHSSSCPAGQLGCKHSSRGIHVAAGFCWLLAANDLIICSQLSHLRASECDSCWPSANFATCAIKDIILIMEAILNWEKILVDALSFQHNENTFIDSLIFMSLNLIDSQGRPGMTGPKGEMGPKGPKGDSSGREGVSRCQKSVSSIRPVWRQNVDGSPRAFEVLKLGEICF